MRERGIPDGWSATEASRLGDESEFSSFPLPETPGQPPAGRRVHKKVLRRSLDPAAPPPVDLEPPIRSRRSRRANNRIRGSSFLEQEVSSLQPIKPSIDVPTVDPKPKGRRWSKSWVMWVVLGGLVSGGIGFMAVALLLKLPAVPNCPSIFWPTATASVRLYCAQVAANKQTLKDLLEAIALVKALPPDHPLHEDIENYLEQWSLDILALGDDAFQAGKLQEAIAIARKIPPDVPAYKMVEQRIERWQSIWLEAEGIYKDAEAELREQHWHPAFMIAVRLLNVGNNYWATTKYEDLKNRIETAREDGNKLAKAQSLAATGGLENLLEAIKQAESIGANSYIYKDAQAAIPEYGRKILNLAQENLERRNVDAAIEIARKIPSSTGLELEAQDFAALAEAKRSAWSGTVVGLENAITQAQNIGSERPLYNQAQELVANWQREIEDLAHLERARQLAQAGTVGDLTAAIAEAQLIPDKNPRASEASKDIRQWRGQVETIEDRPYLDRAEQLATLEDVTSLQAAIDEASHIANGRALYREAYRKIRKWNRKIEEIQDQPYLDQARAYAGSGNLPAAIATAQQIQPGRALSSLAQATIDDWQGQLQARLNWQQARRVAVRGTPDSLAEAIRFAERVPRTSPLRNDVNQAIEQWSQQIFSVAQNRGEYDIPGAIAIAKMVPPGNDTYKTAQEQIDLWQKFLNPEPENPEPTPNEETTTSEQ